MNQPKRNQRPHMTSTPHAAAVAGIVFACLFGGALALLLPAYPQEAPDPAVWSKVNGTRISIATALIPFAGIAFLWFLGVVRDRLGSVEDKFFATVMLGSGLAFIILAFIPFAIVGGVMAAYQLGGDALPKSVYLVSWTVIDQIFAVYALKMASVFMLSLGTLWSRTGAMPRILALLTYALALVMLISLNFSPWMVMIFPAWVLIISLYLLVTALRGKATGSADSTPAPLGS